MRAYLCLPALASHHSQALGRVKCLIGGECLAELRGVTIGWSGLLGGCVGVGRGNVRGCDCEGLVGDDRGRRVSIGGAPNVLVKYGSRGLRLREDLSLLPKLSSLLKPIYLTLS